MEADHSPPFISEYKNLWIYVLLPHAPSCLYRDNCFRTHGSQPVFFYRAVDVTRTMYTSSCRDLIFLNVYNICREAAGRKIGYNIRYLLSLDAIRSVFSRFPREVDENSAFLCYSTASGVNSYRRFGFLTPEDVTD